MECRGRDRRRPRRQWLQFRCRTPAPLPVQGADAVSAELTEDKAKIEKLLERYEAEGSTSLAAFVVLEGAAVGVVFEKEPTSKRIVLHCLE